MCLEQARRPEDADRRSRAHFTIREGSLDVQQLLARSTGGVGQGNREPALVPDAI
jgi:hypothetical protein